MKNPAILALAAAPVLVLSACGGSSSSTATATDTASTPAVSSHGSGSGIHVASTSLGKVLVDGSGRTLYLLTADSPGHSTCDASCVQYWPVVKPGPAAKDVTATVGRTTTPGGAPIATAGGWPLYTFVQDQSPGEVTGEGMATFGGVWYAVSPSGQPVKQAPTATPSSGDTKSAPAQGYAY
jgi:predicted lipoprotein with Yx(FWY)xxD motif